VAANEVILKLVNATAEPVKNTVSLAGVKKVGRGTLTVLQSDNLTAVNTLDVPARVAPQQSEFAPAGTTFALTLPAHSFTVVRVGVGK